ncbi:hypothetical protein MIR68_006453 [Amoeboaphelidium protococcarum]|nr:hypothetical protein MIR68_006453 [Amoeboaphelidium protococcarum]
MDLKFPTPDLSHLSKNDFERVYEPSEDTFLMLDALETDLEELKLINPQTCIEIGSGSGVISTFMAQILKSNQTLYLCTDINIHACDATLRTGSNNEMDLNVVNDCFASSLVQRLRGGVDVMIWNPPYVVSSHEEVVSVDKVLSSQTQSVQGDNRSDQNEVIWSCSGGVNGRELIDQLFQSQQIETLLKVGGVFYLLAIKQNDIQDLIALGRRHNLLGSILIERRAGIEYLYVIKYIRQSNIS